MAVVRDQDLVGRLARGEVVDAHQLDAELAQLHDDVDQHGLVDLRMAVQAAHLLVGPGIDHDQRRVELFARILLEAGHHGDEQPKLLLLPLLLADLLDEGEELAQVILQPGDGMAEAILGERAGMHELAVDDLVARRGAEPRAVAGGARELGRDDPDDHGLHRLAEVAIEQARLEGAHQVVGRVARRAEVERLHLVAVGVGEQRGQRLVVRMPWPNMKELPRKR